MPRRHVRRGLAAVAVAAVVFAPTTASANMHPDNIPVCHPDHQCSYTYYSDATKTEVIGIGDTFCDGSVYRQGRMSPYINFHESPC